MDQVLFKHIRPPKVLHTNNRIEVLLLKSTQTRQEANPGDLQGICALRVMEYLGILGELCPLPNSYVEVLTLKASEYAYIWKQGHCRSNLLRCGHTVVEWAANPLLLVVLLNRRKLGQD